MATRVKQKIGYENYLRLPTGDGKRYEILDGELYVTPCPTPQHQRLSKRLQRQLEAHFETRGLGEVFNAPLDVLLAQYDIVEPDLLVVTEPSQVGSRAIERAPALVVEILSPSTRAQDRGIKTRRYAATGVAHYWIVDPDAETLECFRLESGEYRLVVAGSPPETIAHPDWPGLTIDLGTLWR